MKKNFPILFAIALLLTACSNSIPPTNQANQSTANTTSQGAASNDDNSTAMTSNFDQSAMPEKGEQIVMMQTSKGTIKIRLFPQFAPKTVENFVGLAEKGYYDGLTFHRVMENFMIQGGDPKGDGTGGESFWGGVFENEINMSLSNIRGSLAMANAGKDTNGSQFFINQVDNTYLNGYENGTMKSCTYPESCHTVFGQVFEGMEVVDEIAQAKTDPNTNKPFEDVKMEKVVVESY